MYYFILCIRFIESFAYMSLAALITTPEKEDRFITPPGFLYQHFQPEVITFAQ